MRPVRPRLIHLLGRLEQRSLGWKLIRWILRPHVDENGVILALVALIVMALLAAFSILLDITGAMIRKQQLQTMIELGAAAGGRIVSEKIAELANQNVSDGLTAPPSEADKKYPEKFLTPAQRNWIQTDPGLKQAVEQTVRGYAWKNQPVNFPSFDAASDISIVFPETYNDCVFNSPEKQIRLKATGKIVHPFILGKLAAQLGSSEVLPLFATGLYSIRLCP